MRAQMRVGVWMRDRLEMIFYIWSLKNGIGGLNKVLVGVAHFV